MTEDYEFHVSGLLGPVVRSALPELTACAAPTECVLTGMADGPDDVTQLLERLADHHLVATHIVISSGDRWVHGETRPDPGGG